MLEIKQKTNKKIQVLYLLSLLYNLVMSVIIMHLKKRKQVQFRWTLLFRYERFINFWLRFFDTRKKGQNSYNANPTQHAAHLAMLKISILLLWSRPEKSNRHRNGRKLNSVPQWQKLNCLPPWSNLFFKILKFSGPSLLGMTSSTLQPHFLSGGLLWQWWLSYPLHASVKLHPMTMQLNS